MNDPGHDRIPAEVLRTFPGAMAGSVDVSSSEAVAWRLEVTPSLVAELRAETAWHLDGLERLGYHDVVIGLSGGLDSVVATAIARDAAVGRRHVRAVTVDLGRPGDGARTRATRDSASRLGVEHIVVMGAAVRESLELACPRTGPWSSINTDTRTIQACIGRVADATGSSVISTVDLSERLLGRFTEGFYGQIAPLGLLYKTEVDALATQMGVRSSIIDSRPGCDDHWYDDEILGAPYGVLDPVLHLLSFERLSIDQVASTLRIHDRAWLERLDFRLRTQPLRVNTAAMLTSRRTDPGSTRLARR